MNISFEIVGISVAVGILILNLLHYFTALLKRNATRRKVKELENRYLDLVSRIRRKAKHG